MQPQLHSQIGSLWSPWTTLCRQSLVETPTWRITRPTPVLAVKRAHLPHRGCLSFSHKWYLKIHIFSGSSWALHSVICFPFLSRDCGPFALSLLPRLFYFWKTDFSTLLPFLSDYECSWAFLPFESNLFLCTLFCHALPSIFYWSFSLILCSCFT